MQIEECKMPDEVAGSRVARGQLSLSTETTPCPLVVAFETPLWLAANSPFSPTPFSFSAEASELAADRPDSADCVDFGGYFIFFADSADVG
jgi:hypothetical protein